MDIREYLDKVDEIISGTKDPHEMLARLGKLRDENINSVAAETPKEMLHEIEAASKAEQRKHEEEIRSAVKERGGVYWRDVNARIVAELPGIPHTAMAAASAERLLHRHLQGPAENQRPFTVSCRRPLDCVWGVLEEQSDADELRAQAARWLQDYYESPLNHNLGQDGPNDADDNPAAATIHAVESLVKNSVESTTWAMGRVIEAGMHDAELELNLRMIGHDEYISQLAHPTFQRELRWLEDVLKVLKSNPTTGSAIMELRLLATRDPS